MTSLLTPVVLDDGLDNEWSDDDEQTSSTLCKKLRTSASHERLIKSISQLDTFSLSVKKIRRQGPTGKVSDQEVSGSTGKTVSVSALLKKFDNSVEDKAIKHRLKAKKHPKTLAEPLRKTDAAKLQRTVAYEEVSKDLRKWDPIVSENRMAEGVSFPLDQTKLKIQTTSEYIQRYTKKTAFEQEIEKLVGSSKNNLTKTTVLTEAEKEALKAMSFEEANFRRQELQKSRALLSYKEQKARWQAKIKSKGYHRHLRRSKRKIEEKEFEELQRTNPGAAAAKLELLDRKRIEERLTLKHRNMGKWARHTATHAKTDKGAREALQEQLRLSRNLTEKRQVESEDSDSSQAEPNNCDPAAEKLNKILETEAANNPWMSLFANAWGNSEIDQQFAELQELEEEQEVKHPEKRSKQQPEPAPLANRSRPPPKKPREHSVTPDFDEFSRLVDRGEELENVSNVVKQPIMKGVSAQFQANTLPEVDTDIDPSNVITAVKVKPRQTIVSTAEDLFSDEGDGDESDQDQRKVIAEAFADDDVVGEFRKEKVELADKETVKDIDLTLPGWGEWAGAGIGPAKKKKKFVVKAPKGKPRKDKFLTNVIISERQDEKVVPYQVKELPFPFTTVAQFHSSVRAPIGKTWNTESAFEELTKPKFTTKLGVVIKPLNKKLALERAKRKEMEDIAAVRNLLEERCDKIDLSESKKVPKRKRNTDVL